jgi:hypothetical protein
MSAASRKTPLPPHFPLTPAFSELRAIHMHLPAGGVSSERFLATNGPSLFRTSIVLRLRG